MPKNVSVSGLQPDDCAPTGPNGWCRHGYPFYTCSMIVNRLREQIAAPPTVREILERAEEAARLRIKANVPCSSDLAVIDALAASRAPGGRA